MKSGTSSVSLLILAAGLAGLNIPALAGGPIVKAQQQAPDESAQPPETHPQGPSDIELAKIYHTQLFFAAWEAGLEIADTDGSGGVDGNDVEAFYAAQAADVNSNGALDKQDMYDMLSMWAKGVPEADLNQDGGVDGADLETFFSAFENVTLPTPRALFLAVWEAGLNAADRNGDGGVDGADLENSENAGGIER